MSIVNVLRSIYYTVKKKPLVANISYLYPNSQLKARKVIITGGGRGLGCAMAKKFVAEGADVLIAGRNENMLKRSAESIGCKYLVLDVQNTSSFDSFIEKASAMLEGLNCLVNNAGISLHEPTFMDVTTESFDSQYNTNLKGAFFLTQSFIRYCQKNHDNETKNILFVSSETSMTVDERPYGLTKASINSLIQGLAYRYVKAGYRINAIAPGITVSDMAGGVGSEDISLMSNPTGRYYLPEEVAEIACFLLSDASNCLNGQILVCNEGRTINARWK
ncbi:SDR family NAD(P)-dependent oxidoreductase [Parabacteroides johnsonii]|uniref:SDR family NAD(P)-dependent oxidoreductase n=1 Tax=Parabacteroides johnsonii TaxID=387661 RepID=UPI003AB5D3A9